YPYFAFNFTLAGYPLTFLTMLVVSISTGTLVSGNKEHEKMRLETEREKMRANLLRAVSHDLRTPLTAIIGTINTVLENDEALSRETKTKLLSGAREDTQWLIRMVENLLSITRIEGQDAKIEKQPEAVEEVLGEAVRKFRKQCPGLIVHVSVPDDLLMVPMDAILIEQVLLNLMENAAEHGQTVSEINVSVISRGRFAVFSVIDNGVGLDLKELPRLFSGYLGTAVHSGGADSKRNMGIGLSVCTTIIHAHGGQISAENVAGGGAAFRFTLPLEDETC
ncbi:MAG: ATP-binding protein, partial [Oscillospiraceae bacterium]|nr:ATP-binding protein [Oscillospiraceae bacterium]